MDPVVLKSLIKEKIDNTNAENKNKTNQWLVNRKVLNIHTNLTL